MWMGNLEKNQKEALSPFSCFQDREHRLKLFRFRGQARGEWVGGERFSRFDSEVRRSEEKRRRKKKLVDAFVSRV
jgi:hypothetical protein